jgi:uncharacterized protein
MIMPRLHSSFSQGIIKVALFLSEWVIPAAIVFGVIKLIQYLFITNWDEVLFTAARNGDVQKLQEAIRKKANIEVKKRFEITPLMIAVVNNHSAAVSALIAAGANIDARDEEGRSALLFAAQKGSVDIVQMLLAKGADPNTKSLSGNSPLILSANFGHLEVLRTLIARGADIRWKNQGGLNALHGKIYAV